MNIKDSLPSSYLSFIEKYDQPFEVVDKKTGTKWNIATLNNSSFCLENYASLIQELADEACDFYSDISNRKQVSKDFIKNFIVIGKHTDYFLCLNGEEVWQIVLDPGEIKKLSSKFRTWDIEIFSSKIKGDDERKHEVEGKWQRDEEDTFFFQRDGKCIRTLNDYDFKYEWNIINKKGENHLWLNNLEFRTEHWCKIKKLDNNALIYVFDGEEIELTRI